MNKSKKRKFFVQTPAQPATQAERRAEYDSKRVLIVSAIRITEPRASEVLEDMKIINQHYGEDRAGVIAGIKLEANRIRGMK